MRFFQVLLLGILIHSSPVWETDFDKAVEKAKEEHKLILISFSGSDWCIPCIRMHKEIFESSAFKDFGDSNLVLVNIDFPRLKKNQLSKDQQKQNDKLADKYDPQGSFPYTILMDEKKNVLMNWDGYPDMSPEKFTTELKKYVNARK